MPVTARVCSTPHYMLMDGKRRMAPDVVRSPSGIECLPVYGFSDRTRYEAFRLNSELALVPYPLVRVFLRDQIQASDDELKLIVIDAAGPDEVCLDAASMEAVLVAHEISTNRVDAAYRLIRDPQANAYRVEEASA